MDKKKLTCRLGWLLYILVFLALYLLIYEKVGRAQSVDQFELAVRAENLIYEEEPGPKTPSSQTGGRQPSVLEAEKLQYEPTLQVPAALMNEGAAPAEENRGARYGEGRDLYLDPSQAEPKVSAEAIVENGDETQGKEEK